MHLSQSALLRSYVVCCLSFVNLSHFRLLIWKLLNRIYRNLALSKNLMSSSKFVFLGRSENQDGRPGLWLAESFRLLWNSWMEFNKNWQEARTQCPLGNFCFSGLLETKVAALAYDMLRPFRFLFCNHRTGFDETWQKARSQHCVFWTNRKTKVAHCNQVTRNTCVLPV